MSGRMSMRPKSILSRAATSALGLVLSLMIAACGGGGDSSEPAATMPAITTQPADTSVIEGSTATLSVVATGTAPLSYQWSSSTDDVTFVAIAGATSASYVTGAATLAQNGTHFRVAVSNAAGSVTSSAVQLTVTALIIAPAITVQPADQVVTAPTTATFNVTATGTTPTYQWQVSTDAGATFAAISGATTATLTVVNTVTTLSGSRYRVVVSNSKSSVTSTAAMLTVNPTPVAPAFTTQPLPGTIVAGQGATFIVVATGLPTPTIQWQLNGSALADGIIATGTCAGATATGSATSTLTLTVVPLACNGATIGATASNGVSPVATSSSVVLTVGPVPMPPVVTAQPMAQTVLTGANAAFSVSATGPSLTYQWRKNGANIVGATAATYTTPAVTYLDSGALYTVVVTNADGTVTSSPAALNLMASADQALAQTFLSNGSYQIVWNLNYSGPETAGTNYASYDSSMATLPVLTSGPQTLTQTPRVNLTTSLPIVYAGPTRVLSNGTILIVLSHDEVLRTSFVGGSVQVDQLAADGVTVAYSHIRSNYSEVPLAGDVKTSTPADMAHELNSFFSNPAILNAGVSYPAGAAYLKFFGTTLGDRYNVYDCGAATTTADPSPCYTSTTLASALAAGITSTSDGVTYHAADGAFLTLGGVPVWVATAPRPQSAVLSAAVQYHFYYQRNGNVYTGSLTRDGQPFGGGYYVGTPGIGTAGLVFLPFTIRLNQQATAGLAAAMGI